QVVIVHHVASVRSCSVPTPTPKSSDRFDGALFGCLGRVLGGSRTKASGPPIFQDPYHRDRDDRHRGHRQGGQDLGRLTHVQVEQPLSHRGDDGQQQQPHHGTHQDDLPPHVRLGHQEQDPQSSRAQGDHHGGAVRGVGHGTPTQHQKISGHGSNPRNHSRRNGQPQRTHHKPRPD